METPYETPQLGASVPDTHAHLDMLDDPAGALARAAVAGVSFVGTVVDVTESPETTFDGLGAWIEDARLLLSLDAASDVVPPEVRIVVGCHPHNARDYDSTADQRLRDLARDPRVAAIGETGLDFHYDHSPRDAQRVAFRAQLAIAHDLGLPVVVHLREAHEEGVAILEEVGVPEAGCVIHCFTADAQLATRFVAMGCHVSFAGPLTFRKAEEIRAAAAVVPAHRLLVETDCPFLAPDPYRGRTNEPALVTYTAAALARARDVEPAVLGSQLLANARAVFACGRESDR